MDVIPLSYSVSITDTELDVFLFQRDLIERFHDTIHLSGIVHKHENLIRPEMLVPMWNITLEIPEG